MCTTVLLSSLSHRLVLGTCAELYTPEMVQSIAVQMTPGHIKLTRLEKVEVAFDKYLQKVRQNLHVIVCLDTSGKSMSVGRDETDLAFFFTILLMS